MSLMWDEIMEQPKVLSHCFDKNREVLDKIVRDIKGRDPRSIILAARGTSDNAAVYGKYVLEMATGLPVTLAAPSIVTIYRSTLSFKDTVVIGISQSDRAGDVGAVLRRAKLEGSITIAITNDAASPLATEALYQLNCSAGQELSVAATKTFTAEMFLLASLAAQWSGNAELMDELNGMPQKLAETFLAADEINRITIRYRFIMECFILARGINYAIALETALKIQETCYVSAKAFAVSDFHHGPMALIDKDMPFIVFAPAGPSLDSVKEMVKTLTALKADVFIISDNADTCRMGDCSLRVPAAKSDITSPFINAAVAQMFACTLSTVKGINPDVPRLLNKITITL